MGVAVAKLFYRDQPVVFSHFRWAGADVTRAAVSEPWIPVTLRHESIQKRCRLNREANHRPGSCIFDTFLVDELFVFKVITLQISLPARNLRCDKIAGTRQSYHHYLFFSSCHLRRQGTRLTLSFGHYAWRPSSRAASNDILRSCQS